MVNIIDIFYVKINSVADGFSDNLTLVTFLRAMAPAAANVSQFAILFEKKR